MKRGARQLGLRFTPSRVEGGSGVTDAVVYPDRVELRGTWGWSTIDFAEITRPAGPPTIFERVLHPLRPAPPVAAIFYSRERYADSYVRFLSDPPVTLYMPPDGPTQFPDSLFNRILEMIRAGGYGYYDADSPPPTKRDEAFDRLPRAVRTVFHGFALLVFVNFISWCVLSIILGGTALDGRVDNGRYLVGKRYREREVSREFWLYSRWHAVTALGGLGALAVAGASLGAYANVRERRQVKDKAAAAMGLPRD